MDWLGDRLSQLIEEGKRALGTEIVVSSEVPEDEVDDGNGDWIEDENASASFAYESQRRITFAAERTRAGGVKQPRVDAVAVEHVVPFARQHTDVLALLEVEDTNRTCVPTHRRVGSRYSCRCVWTHAATG